MITFPADSDNTEEDIKALCHTHQSRGGGAAAGWTLGRLEAGVFLFIFMFYSKNIVYKKMEPISGQRSGGAMKGGASASVSTATRLQHHRCYKKQTQTWSSR